MPGWIWQKQISELSRKYRVIEIDPRSQGESDKPTFGHLPETRAHDYKEFVEQLGLKQPVLIGWSMGCAELLSYVEQFGDDGINREPCRQRYYGKHQHCANRQSQMRYSPRVHNVVCGRLLKMRESSSNGRVLQSNPVTS
jgi:pimeloyl-ACP methyl ester carboxylesterase